MKTYLITLHMEVEVPDEQSAQRVANHLKRDAPLQIIKVPDARSFKILDSIIREKLEEESVVCRCGSHKTTRIGVSKDCPKTAIGDKCMLYRCEECGDTTHIALPT